MSERFIIDCNGIIDTWNSTGKCEDRLSWAELCETLNTLDEIADDKFDNYEYVVKLEKENLSLKRKLCSISGVNAWIKKDLSYIDSIIQGEKMISEEKAIKIAKNAMPEPGFVVESFRLHKNIYYVGLKKKKMRYLVDIDAKTGKIVGGAGGAP